MTIASDAAADVQAILLEHGDIFYVTRQATTTDGMGNVTDITETEFRVYAFIVDTSKKDRTLADLGLAIKGNRLMYIKASYSITSGGVAVTNVVKEGDIFKDRNDYNWRVIKIIHEPYLIDTEIYKKCVIQSIGLEGSP